MDCPRVNFTFTLRFVRCQSNLYFKHTYIHIIPMTPSSLVDNYEQFASISRLLIPCEQKEVKKLLITDQEVTDRGMEKRINRLYMRH